jgi:FG-GAP repeat
MGNRLTLRSMTCKIVAAAIICSAPSWAAQSNQNVGGEWEAEYYFEPAYTNPPMKANGSGMMAIGDIDFDGVVDFVFVASGSVNSDGGLIAVSGATGQRIWSFGYLLDLGVQGTPNGAICLVQDLDGDSFCEILAADRLASVTGSQRNSGVVTLHSGRTGALLWMIDDPDVLGDQLGRGLAGLGDINGDGFAEIAVSAYEDIQNSWACVIHIFSGSDFSLMSSITEPISGQTRTFSFMSGLDQRIDADLDGVADLLVKTGPASSELISPVTGQTIYEAVDCCVAIGPPLAGVTVVDDLDGDGFPDYVSPLGTVDGVACFSGRTGHEIWRRELAQGSVAGVSITRLPDQDGDGIEDLAVGAPQAKILNYQGSGKLHFLSGATGKRQRAVLSGVLGFPDERYLGVSAFYDDASSLLFVREGGVIPGAGTGVGPAIALRFKPFLEASAQSISASAGGLVQFDLDFPVEHAGSFYALGVSATGTGPIKIKDLKIPLTMDSWLQASIANTLPRVFVNRLGLLDAQGKGTVLLGVPPGALSSAVGTSFWFAAVCGSTQVRPSLSSVAWRLDIEP